MVTGMPISVLPPVGEAARVAPAALANVEVVVPHPLMEPVPVKM